MLLEVIMRIAVMAKTVTTPRTAKVTQDSNNRVHGYGKNSNRTAIMELEAQGFGVDLAGTMLAYDIGSRLNQLSYSLIFPEHVLNQILIVMESGTSGFLLDNPQ